MTSIAVSVALTTSEEAPTPEQSEAMKVAVADSTGLEPSQIRDFRVTSELLLAGDDGGEEEMEEQERRARNRRLPAASYLWTLSFSAVASPSHGGFSDAAGFSSGIATSLAAPEFQAALSSDLGIAIDVDEGSIAAEVEDDSDEDDAPMPLPTSAPSAEANDQTTTGEGEEEDEVEEEEQVVAGVKQEGDESEASKAKAAGSSTIVVAALAAGCAVVAALLLCAGLRLSRHSKAVAASDSSSGGGSEGGDGEFVSEKRSSGDIKWTSNPGPVHRSLDIDPRFSTV
jgi:hypothetical protein